MTLIPDCASILRGTHHNPNQGGRPDLSLKKRELQLRYSTGLLTNVSHQFRLWALSFRE